MLLSDFFNGKMTSKLINIEVSEGIPQQKHFYFSVLKNFYFSNPILFFFTFHFTYSQSIIWWWNSWNMLWFIYAWSVDSEKLNHYQIQWIMHSHFSMNEVLSMFFEEQLMNEIDQSYHNTKENRYHSCHLSFLIHVSLILFFLIFFSKFFPIFPPDFLMLRFFISFLFYIILNKNNKNIKINKWVNYN